MSTQTIHLRSYSPDVLVEFELPQGSHARIGASPDAEVTLPFDDVAPFLCTLGRFQDGRMYLADTDGAISQRIDLPATLAFPPYQFVIFNPDDQVRQAPDPEAPPPPRKRFLEKLFHR